MRAEQGRALARRLEAAPIERRWSARATLAFILATCGAFWAADRTRAPSGGQPHRTGAIPCFARRRRDIISMTTSRGGEAVRKDREKGAPAPRRAGRLPRLTFRGAVLLAAFLLCAAFWAGIVWLILSWRR